MVQAQEVRLLQDNYNNSVEEEEEWLWLDCMLHYIIHFQNKDLHDNNLQESTSPDCPETSRDCPSTSSQFPS